MRPCTLEEARAAKSRALEEFGRKVTVVGVGITRMNGGFGVKVNLEVHPAPDAELPDVVDGVPIRVEVVGKLGKQ
jgi:hypothetical protein